MLDQPSKGDLGKKAIGIELDKTKIVILKNNNRRVKEMGQCSRSKMETGNMEVDPGIDTGSTSHGNQIEELDKTSGNSPEQPPTMEVRPISPI